MEVIQTKRLILREFREEDVNDVFEYAQDENVGPRAGWRPHKEIQETKNIVRGFIDKKEVFAICLKETNKVIGSIGAHDRSFSSQINESKEKEIGYVLNPLYWGKGIVTEAVKALIAFLFENRKMNRLTCGHFSFNQASKRVIEKCGFSFVNTKEKILEQLDDQKVMLHSYQMTLEQYHAIISKEPLFFRGIED